MHIHTYMLANVVVMCVDHFDQRQYEDSLWYVPLLSFIIFTYIHVYIYIYIYIYICTDIHICSPT
jgi:hypothetical protein